ncbi:MAG TPA: hypothetical protein VF600_02875 [Abditibacteriaceae bacterium]
MWLGFAGLVAMALLGIGHHGHESGHAHSHGHAHSSHGHHDVHAHDAAAAHGHHTAVSHHTAHAHHGDASTHGGHAQHNHAQHHQEVGRQISSSLLSWLSPRVLFSVLIGFGATGKVAHFLVAQPALVVLLAVCGGIVWEKLLIAPLWNIVSRFASNPARTLGSSIAEEVQAVTNFDANGNGLVALDLDGQVMQILATLRREERDASLPVRRGDKLLVIAVDEAHNCCTVSRLMS